jgi:hypothetical protein
MKQTNAMKNIVGTIMSDKDVTKNNTVVSPTNEVASDDAKPSRQKKTDSLEASGEKVIKTTYSIRQSTHKKVRLLATLTSQNLPEIIDQALNEYIEKMVAEHPELKAVLEIK